MIATSIETTAHPAAQDAPAGQVMDLIFGRWRSQILHAGVHLGVFDAVGDAAPSAAEEIAPALGADPPLLYRLMRALASLGLLRELPGRRFVRTAAGALLARDHPATLRGVTLLEEGPVHYALWTHLPQMIRDGRQNAFQREFGRMAFDHAAADPAYGGIFNEAMTSYSNVHTAWVIEALEGCDLRGASELCDVGGGHGHLAAALLAAYPHLRGTVLDLPQVVVHEEARWAPRLGVAGRCTYVPGDMFAAVPPADLYLMKLILHDWNDEECVTILSNAARAARPGARLFVVEHVVPEAGGPHFATLFDIHMMCWGTGRERTVGEYAALAAQSGWRYARTWQPAEGLVSVLEMQLARS